MTSRLTRTVKPITATVIAATLAATGTAATSTLAAPAAQAKEVRNEYQPSGPGASCGTPKSLLKRHTVNLSQLNRGKVTISGYTFNFVKNKWRIPKADNPTASQMFHTSAWVVPLLKDRPGQAVNLLLQQAKLRPDTGVATATIRVNSGWSESQVTKRMWTVLCVLDATRDTRLIPVLNNLAQANMDQNRYYGPPVRVAHNHGVFANEVLYAAGTYTGNSKWTKVAEQRLRDMLPEIFETCGMAYEQSATYHALNVRLWERQLRKLPGLSAADILKGPYRALAAIASPDGQIEPIGDGERGKYDLSKLQEMGVTPSGSVWCEETGWWARHQNLKQGGVSHVVARFGPPQAMHGDDDATSLTWWTGSPDGDGVAVLSERGLHSKKRDARYKFVNSDGAHSVLSRVGDPFTSSAASGRRVKNPGMQSARFVTEPDKGTYRRMVTYSTRAPMLAVSDTVRKSRSGSGFVQYWQLGTEWVPARGHTATTSDGHTLDILCFVDGKQAQVQLTEVESFPAGNMSEPAYRAQCSAAKKENVRFDTVLLVDAGTVSVLSQGSPSSITVSSDQGTVSTTKGGRWVHR